MTDTPFPPELVEHCASALYAQDTDPGSKPDRWYLSGARAVLDALMHAPGVETVWWWGVRVRAGGDDLDPDLHDMYAHRPHAEDHVEHSGGTLIRRLELALPAQEVDRG